MVPDVDLYTRMVQKAEEQPDKLALVCIYIYIYIYIYIRIDVGRMTCIGMTSVFWMN